MLIIDDLKAKAKWCYGRSDWRAMVKVCATDGTMAMCLYRLMQWSRRKRLEPLAMLFNKLNGILCQCIIGRGADFGPEFVLIHSQGIVINGNVRGGANIFLEHQVTIGAEKDASPILGNNIFIGAGAKLVGQIAIGDGVRIGANAVVVRDVPNEVTVGGIPARIIKRHNISNETPVTPHGQTSASELIAEPQTESNDEDLNPNRSETTPSKTITSSRVES